VIELEVIAGCTLDRAGQRVSLNRGARLKIAEDDDTISDRQLRRLIDAGKLRPIAGLAALARRLQDEDGAFI
jgi:hypothetical protein